KIIAMSLPRISRRRRVLIPRRSLSLNSASPVVIVFFLLFRPMIVRHVTLFPEPDSPTIPSVFPFSTEKLTPSTALTMPSSVRKYVLRSWTSSSAISGSPLCQPDPRIDPRVEKVDDEVEEDDRA